MTSQANHPAPNASVRVFASVVAVATAAASGYFAVGGVLTPGALVAGGDDAAARVFAAYMSARGVVLLGALLLCAALRAWRPLALVLALNAAVQAVDAVIGAVRHEPAQAIGPACFALLLAAAAALLGRTPR
ncbi:hypothetical protein ABZ860_34305 [Microbispora sp. NPDC046973]|uniref:hypothetical protein n=1 Tax=Microbispora sp. NPDC046973 TaxID=3155022 RepID=UPI0033C95961